MKRWRQLAFAAALVPVVRCGRRAAPPAPSESPATPGASASTWDREFDAGAAETRIALARSGWDELAMHWQLGHGRTADARATERFFALLPGKRPLPLESAKAPNGDGRFDVFLGYSDWWILAVQRHVIGDEEARTGLKLLRGGLLVEDFDPIEFVETETVPAPIRHWIDGIAKPLDDAVAAFELPIPLVDFKSNPELWIDAGAGRVIDASRAIRCRAAIACVDGHPDAAIALLTSYLAFLARLPVLPRMGDYGELGDEDHETIRMLTAVVRTRGCSEDSSPRLRTVVEGIPAAEVRRRAVDLIRWGWLGSLLRHSYLLEGLIFGRPGVPGAYASRLRSMGIGLIELRDLDPLLFAEDDVWRSIHASFVEEPDWRRAFERAVESIGSAESPGRLRRIAAAMWCDDFKMSLEGIDAYSLSPSLRSFEDRCALSAAMKLARDDTVPGQEHADVVVASANFPVDPVFGLPPAVEVARDHRSAQVSIDRQRREMEQLREQLAQDIARVGEALRAALPARGK